LTPPHKKKIKQNKKKTNKTYPFLDRTGTFKKMLLIHHRNKIKTQITIKDHFLTNKTVCREKEKLRR
jgi:hypothetical protein